MSRCLEVFLLHQFLAYKYKTYAYEHNKPFIYCSPKTSLAAHERGGARFYTTVIKTKAVVLRLVKVSDESESPELQRDHKTPSLIILFKEKVSRPIFFKGTHNSQFASRYMCFYFNDLYRMCSVCYSGKSPQCLHLLNASILHLSVKLFSA